MLLSDAKRKLAGSHWRTPSSDVRPVRISTGRAGGSPNLTQVYSDNKVLQCLLAVAERLELCCLLVACQETGGTGYLMGTYLSKVGHHTAERRYGEI